jgi:hypothetical protein
LLNEKPKPKIDSQQRKRLNKMSNPAKHLLQMSIPQVEQALVYLADPEQEHPPQELQHLHPLEWSLLNNLLNKLEWEKEHSPIQ